MLHKENGGFSDDEDSGTAQGKPVSSIFGLTEFQKEAPFDPSKMVHYRKRLNAQIMNEINELICLSQEVKKLKSDKDNHDAVIKPKQYGAKSNNPLTVLLTHLKPMIL